MPGAVRTGATFADAAAEFLRYSEHDRGCKPSTLRDYRSTLNAHLLPAFGSLPLEDMRYLHYAPHGDEAALVAEAFSLTRLDTAAENQPAP